MDARRRPSFAALLALGLAGPALSLAPLARLGAQAAATSAAPRAGSARGTTSGVDSARLARIRDEGMQRSRVLETATVLSDVFGPRLAGSPAYRAAAEWTRRTLAGYGLTSARLEPWGARGGLSWTVERHSLELDAPFFESVPAYELWWCPP